MRTLTAALFIVGVVIVSYSGAFFSIPSVLGFAFIAVSTMTAYLALQRVAGQQKLDLEPDVALTSAGSKA